MRVCRLAAPALLGFGLWVSGAKAAVDIEVDLSSQVMHVRSASGEAYDWPVSTARKGFATPRGSYGVESLQRMHFSRKYHNSPMPHSIFFRGGYAIHGTSERDALGSPASHGCVRLAPEHAARLFGMVRAEGARINIVGRTRHGALREARRRQKVRVAAVGSPRSARHHKRVYAHRRPSADLPIAYAPLRRGPSYDDWMSDPFGMLE